MSAELDPPADRVDIAAFTAKTLADELVARLDRLGLACTRLRIEAETDQAETLSRVWRYDPTPPTNRPYSSPDPVSRSPGPADPPARTAAVMAERVRWQLDGWLTGRTGHPPGALIRLTLVPDEVVPDQGRQLGFWGGESEPTQRAARALARVQGLLGPEAVQTARLHGGRDPATRVTLASGEDTGLPPGRRPRTGAQDRNFESSPPARPPFPPSLRAPPAQLPASGSRTPGPARPGPPDPALPGRVRPAPGPARGSRSGPEGLPGAVPWPGQVPAPAPAIVYAEPLPAEVVDAAGATVTVDGRGLLGSRPSRVRVWGRAWSAITAWAGPWLVDERWWDPAAHRRLVRLQATTDQGAAYLLRLTGGRWWVEAIYD